MKLLLILLFLHLKVAVIISDSDSIKADYDLDKNNFEINLVAKFNEIAIDLGDRGKNYTVGLRFLKTNIVDRLLILRGRLVWPGREIFKIHEKFRKTFDSFFDYSSIRKILSVIDGIEDSTLTRFDEVVENFVLSTDDQAILDSCWSDANQKIITAFENFVSGIDTAFTDTFTSLDIQVKALESQRLENFNEYRKKIRDFRYRSQIFNYVRKHSNNT